MTRNLARHVYDELRGGRSFSERKDMTLDELRTTKREAILRAAAMRGVRNIRGSGSAGRGESDEASDIDFLVDLESDRSLFDLSGLRIDLEAPLGTGVELSPGKDCVSGFGIEFFERRCRCER